MGKRNGQLLILAGLAVLSVALLRSSSFPTHPKNVIFVVADALSAQHMSLYGYSRQTTPFIDDYFGRLGVVFKDVSSTAPWTVPSLSSFLTSQYPTTIGMETFGDRLSGDIPSLPGSLRAGGVDLAAFPQGIFQIRQVKSSSGLAVFRQFGVVETFQTDEVTRTKGHPQMFQAAADWIKSRQAEGRKDKPFFIWMHSLITHSPYDPPPAYQKLFGGPEHYPGAIGTAELDEAKQPGALTEEEKIRFRLQYDQDIRYFDDSLKSFIQGLSKDVRENSTIILIGDHGEAFGEHGKLEHASTLYQEMIQVPMLINSPGLVPSKVSSPVSLLDLSPTILDLFGLSSPKSFQGQSLLSLARGVVRSPELIRSERANDPLTGKDDIAKGIDPQVRTAPLPLGQTAVRLGNWKLIQNPDQSLELYNLSSDPGELVNLISRLSTQSQSDRDIVQRLTDSLKVNLPK